MQKFRAIIYLLQNSFVEKVFFVFLLLCTYQTNAGAKECDFVKCIVGVKDFLFDLKIEKDSFNCKRLTDIPECSESCLQKYFPNLFLQENLNQPTFSQLCVENISKRSNVNWSCISSHSFRLLTCFANVSSITTNSVQDDVIVAESCRKNVEFQNCPSQVLLDDCGEESVNVVKNMLLFILNHLKPSCKGVDFKELLYMPVHYHLDYNLMQAAMSFDTRFLRVTQCFEQLIQEETDLSGFLCGTYDPLSDCIQFSLTEQRKALPAVRHLVLHLFSLANMKCRIGSPEPKHLPTQSSQKSLKPISESSKSFSHKTDKVYDLPGSSPKLSSEKSITFHSKSTETVSVSSFFNETVKNKSKDKIHQEVVLKDSPDEVNENKKQINKFSEEQDNMKYLKASTGIKAFVSKILMFIIFILYVFR